MAETNRIFSALKKSLFLASLALCISAAFSQSFPSLEPAFTFNSRGPDIFLSPREMITAGLTFSLCTPESAGWKESLSRYDALERKVLRSRDEIYSAGKTVESEKALGEKILTLMYEDILSRYESGQTRLDTMLLNGTYNCVSSSVLYHALAKACGLTVTAQKAPEHAFCTLTLSDGTTVDVETTNPFGFEPGVRHELPSEGNETRYAVVPRKLYTGRHSTSERIHIGLVAGNISAQLMDEKNYAQAVPLAAARLAFTQEQSPDADEVRTALDTICCNYSNEFQKNKEHPKAAQWLYAVTERWGMTGHIQTYYDNAVRNTVIDAINKKEILSGRFKEQYERFYPLVSAPVQKEINSMLFTESIIEASQNMNAEKAIAYLRNSRETKTAQGDKKIMAQINSLLEYSWLTKINDTITSYGYLEGAREADEAVRDLPSSANLKKLKQQCLQNHAITVHNEFAGLANEGKFSEARKILEAGLEQNPQSKILLDDLKKLKKILGE